MSSSIISFGKLPYRSLAFEHVTLQRSEWFQPVARGQLPARLRSTPASREFKHLTGQTHPQTS